MGPREIPPGLLRPACIGGVTGSQARRCSPILDDAADRAQIEPLLPGTSGCLVLVTSRRRLVGFDGAEPLPLDTLTADQSALLFSPWSRPHLRLPGPRSAPSLSWFACAVTFPWPSP